MYIDWCRTCNADFSRESFCGKRVSYVIKSIIDVLIGVVFTGIWISRRQVATIFTVMTSVNIKTIAHIWIYESGDFFSVHRRRLYWLPGANYSSWFALCPRASGMYNVRLLPLGTDVVQGDLLWSALRKWNICEQWSMMSIGFVLVLQEI